MHRVLNVPADFVSPEVFDVTLKLFQSVVAQSRAHALKG